jgi:hypothetical protein
MHWLAGIALGLLLAASVFVATRALVALVRKQWRSFRHLLAGVGLFLIYGGGLGIASYLLASASFDGTNLEPADKARILAEVISLLMNTSVWGAPIGLLLALAAEMRRKRR